MSKDQPDSDRLSRIVVDARRNRERREKDYREQALKIYPWICARCGREFDRKNLKELTVHHRDHNHDNNPADGSNWELLCIYCHDNEHSRYVEYTRFGSAERNTGSSQSATHRPFGELGSLLKKKK